MNLSVIRFKIFDKYNHLSLFSTWNYYPNTLIYRKDSLDGVMTDIITFLPFFAPQLESVIVVTATDKFGRLFLNKHFHLVLNFKFLKLFFIPSNCSTFSISYDSKSVWTYYKTYQNNYPNLLSSLRCCHKMWQNNAPGSNTSAAISSDLDKATSTIILGRAPCHSLSNARITGREQKFILILITGIFITCSCISYWTCSTT